MYVFAGLAPGWKPLGMVYEYDPATNSWTKKKPMALPSHHVAFTEYRGKIYAFGGFVPPESGPPAGCQSTMHGNTIPRPIPGKLWRRCRANAVPRWQQQSTTRFM